MAEQAWIKSSYSGSEANCVEVSSAWIKSSRSGSQANCVEVAHGEPGVVAVRDSKDPGGPVLRFDRAEGKTFTRDVKAGRFGLG
jgi:hypothetical protein